MVVNNKVVLIYAGRTERDAERYITMEGARVVTKFEGDVLADCSSDMYVCEAKPNQVAVWTTAFLAAVDVGKADASDPAGFAISLM